jgi:O-antigen ligase
MHAAKVTAFPDSVRALPQRPDAWIFGFTLASAACTLISIFVAETLGAIACVLWLLYRPRPVFLPPYVIPMCVFMALTVVSLIMSPTPASGIAQINKFVLFPMGLLAANFVSDARRVRFSYGLLLMVAAAGSGLAIIQFAVSYSRYMTTGALADDPTVLARSTGFMSHWMTFSGEQLLVWCAAIPLIVLLGQRWIIPVAIVGIGIIFSFTRSAWLGAAAGLFTVVFSLPRRVVLKALLPVVVVGLLVSGLISHRLSMTMQPGFAPDAGRLALLRGGLQMIHDHPLFGVGPERVYREFPRYSGGIDLTNFYYGHMENNFMQIAVERGLLCFAAFLWLLFELFAGLWRLLKSDDTIVRLTALSGLAVMTGFLVAGLFSYNFGDSEVLMLFLFLVSIPFGMSHQRSAISDQP